MALVFSSRIRGSSVLKFRRKKRSQAGITATTNASMQLRIKMKVTLAIVFGSSTTRQKNMAAAMI
ncbi:hypothetical protein [Pseudoalteromonas rubra]|uniref:hypothetical protein n=1 Tax=Pseudoalteromonas rubra TaxID=43658 RepID=UPI0012E08A1D|nr:hypothetical protein [Pseudoalteromonas rubra]